MSRARGKAKNAKGGAVKEERKGRERRGFDGRGGAERVDYYLLGEGLLF